MKSKPIRALLQTAVILCVMGAGAFSAADEAANDLQAGIDAFNRGDLPGAMSLYKKAAEAGSSEAQVRLAYLLDYAEDNEEAVRWYRAAADQGHPDGMAGLAAMYAKGEGVAEDQEKARQLFEKAGESGHAGSIRVLIEAYENGGLDVQKDATRAAYWKAKQSTGGNGN